MLDIGPFLATPEDATTLSPEARRVATEWREAFGSFGFAHVVGHGVPLELIEDMYEVSKRFFALSEAEKVKDCTREGLGPTMGEGWGHRARHYTPIGMESVSATESNPDGTELRGIERARPPDRVEHLLIHRTEHDLFSSKVPEMKQTGHAYFDEMTELLSAIMEITAVSLDLPRTYFRQYWGKNGSSPHNILRIAHYPPRQKGEKENARRMSYGEHTDYQGYTLLWQQHDAGGSNETGLDCVPPKGGLQVKIDDEFVDCPPPPRAFTVNAGDLIQCWTNDVLVSNTHRVSNPPENDTTTSRISLVFFTGPEPDTLVECLPTCPVPPKYPPVLAGEHLRRKLDVSNMGGNR